MSEDETFGKVAKINEEKFQHTPLSATIMYKSYRDCGELAIIFPEGAILTS